jgi:hypothetical protein
VHIVGAAERNVAQWLLLLLLLLVAAATADCHHCLAAALEAAARRIVDSVADIWHNAAGFDTG